MSTSALRSGQVADAREMVLVMRGLAMCADRTAIHVKLVEHIALGV